MHEPVTTQELEASFTSVDSDTPARQQLGMVNGGKWGMGLKEPDPDEEAYFNGSDDEDELTGVKPVNGASPVRPLVNYPDDDESEDDVDDLAAATPSVLPQSIQATTQAEESQAASKSPPTHLSEKRRREDDDEDELLLNINASSIKRRASLNSNSSAGSLRSLRRKSPNIAAAKESPKKMSISIPLKSGGEGTNGE